MRTDGTEFVQLVEAGSQQIVGALRRAAVDGLDVEGLTDVLKVAFSCRNQVDAAVTGAIGALDRTAEKAPHGEVTATVFGLSRDRAADQERSGLMTSSPRMRA